MSYKPKFQIGDLVIKRQGKNPFEITFVPTYQYGRYIGRYLHNGKNVYAIENSIQLHSNDQENSMTSKNLYSFVNEDGKTVFGTYLATNSENKYILEVKGTGEVVVADPSRLEEVLPYTFKVKIAGKDIHYIGEPGKLQKGDWLILDTGRGHEIATVQEVDTKSKTAREKFKGRKVLTEKI